MHANKSSDLLAWWTLDKATRSRTHASLRLASEQVSSRFRAGLGPASIVDFGLKLTPVDEIFSITESIMHVNFIT